MKTRGDVFLSIREAAMMTVLEEVLSGNVTASEGARRLHCSERKVFRLKAGMKKDGPSGLVHGNRGRYPAKGNMPGESTRARVAPIWLNLSRVATGSS